MKKRSSRSESEYEKLARLIKDEGEDIRGELGRRFDATDNQLRGIRSEIADIRRGLETLEDKFKNIKGVTKEIDHLLARVARIEKHLNIASR
jgi:predicted  nucleic acid-binding Zn-ribbon protein